MTEIALITGISGQDAYYLASYLIRSGVRVVGTTRNVAEAREALGPTLSADIALVDWNLTDQGRLLDILREYRPTRIFNLAALSSGEFMDRNPELVTEVNGVAVLRMLEAIRQTVPSAHFCQASSSEVFAASGISPQDERTPRSPRSVYGAAKIYADTVIGLYREKYGLFCCSAFLFNHESPRRGEGFVTTKVVRAAVAIKQGRQDRLALGNLSAARDWGFAGDSMRAMAVMLEAPAPEDYVVATGTAHTVADLCERAFGAVSLDYRNHVDMDPRFFRPTEPAPIIGDATRIRQALGWIPATSFDTLVAMMVEAELGRHGVRD